MPLDPDGEEGFPKRQSPEAGSRHFLSEGADAAQARLAEARRHSLGWQHSAQRRRDRNRFFFLLLLLAAVLYFLWKEWSPYLPHGATGSR
ncbi:hypothetical protein [Methylacidimicrobium sp. B4]|uniref:hypothetical protein n=1 Tax=Methylacidimicrobium sp. B4 TaxID=2796139 RepID=UPI001A8EA858|nr:hypothetical protein [Methylacidimicrobium sp. B4]QSR83904.1 hypothetical protein MacB4_06395 [Methylacidimicrobium sp. B4]